MCEDRGAIWGGLIVAGAMLVWAFASDHAVAQRQQAPRARAETSVSVSLSPLEAEVRHGRFVLNLAI